MNNIKQLSLRELNFDLNVNTVNNLCLWSSTSDSSDNPDSPDNPDNSPDSPANDLSYKSIKKTLNIPYEFNITILRSLTPVKSEGSESEYEYEEEEEEEEGK